MATQRPSMQVSFEVHGSPSWQATPFAGVKTQRPVLRSQASTVQGLSSLQSIAVRGRHRVGWQPSPRVQGFWSSQSSRIVIPPPSWSHRILSVPLQNREPGMQAQGRQVVPSQ